MHCSWRNEYKKYPRSYEIRREKKIQDRKGYEPMTSVKPVQRSTNWANKLTLFVMKLKPFPELTDILLREQRETSGGQWRKHKLEGRRIFF